MEDICGPAAKWIRAVKRNFLLKAASSSVKPFFPPKVWDPATKTISSPSFLAAAMICSTVSAATRRGIPVRTDRRKSVVNQQAFTHDPTSSPSMGGDGFLRYRLTLTPRGEETLSRRIVEALVRSVLA